MAVAQHLHFHMAGAAHQLFQVELVVAERRQRLAPRHLDRRAELGLGLDHAHAPPAAAPARLEHQRITDRRRHPCGAGKIRRQRLRRRHHRNTGALGQFARGDLVAETPHHLRLGADESDPCGRARHGEIRVLGQETVAGMDGIDLGLARDADDVVDVQVSLDRLLARTDEIGLVSLEAMEGEPVLVGEHGDGANAQFGGSAQHADRDLAAIGHQQAANLLHFPDLFETDNSRARPRFGPPFRERLAHRRRIRQRLPSGSNRDRGGQLA